MSGHSATEGGMGTPDEDRHRLGELNGLAAAYCADGHYETALPLFEKVVAGCAAGLGADDPDTLIGHGNLVVTQLRLDPTGPALGGLDVNVAARRRVLGEEHPATLIAGRARYLAYLRATDELEALLADAEAEVGPEHPDAVALRTELAELRRRLTEGRADAAPEPATAAALIPAPRRPRGARFPRGSAADTGGDTGDGPGTPPARRPRGARFPRGG